MDIKNINMYTRNYSKFSSEDFYDDISIQNWNYDLANPTDNRSALEACYMDEKL